MFPSPSLGPPLLSASWSPPLFCGMPAVEFDAADPPWADVAGVEADELPLEPPPHPATAITSAVSTVAPAASKRGLRMVAPISRATYRQMRPARSLVAG